MHKDKGMFGKLLLYWVDHFFIRFDSQQLDLLLPSSSIFDTKLTSIVLKVAPSIRRVIGTAAMIEFCKNQCAVGDHTKVFDLGDSCRTQFFFQLSPRGISGHIDPKLGRPFDLFFYVCWKLLHQILAIQPPVPTHVPRTENNAGAAASLNAVHFPTGQRLDSRIGLPDRMIDSERTHRRVGKQTAHKFAKRFFEGNIVSATITLTCLGKNKSAIFNVLFQRKFLLFS